LTHSEDSKEGIVKKHYEIKYASPKYDKSVNRVSNMEYISPAMDEWAKKQAIAFNKWFRPYKIAQLEKCAGDKGEWIRIASLPDEYFYDLFIQSQNQTQ
jgi:hypothetical protein